MFEAKIWVLLLSLNFKDKFSGWGFIIIFKDKIWMKVLMLWFTAKV
jgi:hypothetical protein